jgi:hypothetical protein
MKRGADEVAVEKKEQKIVVIETIPSALSKHVR